jgi:hypothetical protein
MCRKAWDGRRRDMEWIDTSKLHQFRYVVNPYLRHLEAQGALCPKCAAKLYIEPASYNPDFGLWVCPKCDVVDGVQAPELASMPMDEAIAADKAMAEDPDAEEPPAERHAAEREAACARRCFKPV